MALNEARGNMYEFVTHTFNTTKGACPYNCAYCYMHKYWSIKHPYFAEKELETDLGSGKSIFVGSSIDMFADNIPDEWIDRTIHHLEKFDNEYFLQTKNPRRLSQFDLLKIRCVVGTTIETNRYYREFMGKTPTPQDRAKHMPKGHSVTIEPIMDFDVVEFLALIKSCEPQYVNIGADSGNNGLPEPSKEKVLNLIKGLKSFTSVHLKKNLNRILGA